MTGPMPTAPKAAGAATVVANASQLTKAFKAATGGETILLAATNFGDVSLHNANPTSLVTIKSADPDADASFRTLKLTNVSNILLEDIDIHNPIAPGAPKTQAMQINKVTNVTLSGIDLAGSLDGDSSNDAHGIIITGGDNISILDSTFRQVRAAIVIGRSSDIIVAGNTITEGREGVNIGQVDGGLFERNLVTAMQPMAHDHPDAFQVHNGSGIGASNDLAFRNNVIIQDNGLALQGIYVHSERDDEGIHHSNISIENNFYRGNSRHAISVTHTDDVLISGNTVLYSGSGGLVPAVLVGDVHGARVERNIATLLYENRNSGSTDLVWADNIDVWDPKFRIGVAESTLFQPMTPGEIDFGRLAPRIDGPGAGLGFAATGEIGGFEGPTGMMMAAYVPQFEAAYATPLLV